MKFIISSLIIFIGILARSPDVQADFLTHATVAQVGNTFSYTLHNDEPQSSSYYGNIFDITTNASFTIIGTPAGWDYFTDNNTYVDWYNTDPALPYPHDVAPDSSLSGFVIESSVATSSYQTYTVTSWDHINDTGGPDFQSQILAPSIQSVPEPTSMILLGTGLAGLVGYTWHRRQRSDR